VVSYLGIIAAVSICGALWLLCKGPVPVVRGAVSLEIDVPFSYMVSAFPFLGMLIAEAVELLMRQNKRQAGMLIAATLALILVSHFRVYAQIPVSGHALLLSYIILRRIVQYHTATAQKKAETAVAAIALLVIAYIKLFSWHDPFTLCVGIVVGAVVWTSEYFITSR
jgi:hypothetical protein